MTVTSLAQIRHLSQICFPILLVLLITCGLAVSTAHATEIPWAAPDTIASSFNGATDAIAADIDGDGDLDVLAAAKAAHDIAWWENTAGDASAWTKHLVDNDFEGAVSVQAADIDRDGDLDVVAAGYDSNEIAWWHNDGTPGDDSAWAKTTFSSPGNGNACNGVRSVYVADVDGDGDPDVLSAAETDNEITWWENMDGLAGLAWIEHTIDAAFDGAWAVYAADLDRDGDLDVLGARADGGGIAWWENTAGDGSAWTKITIDGTLNGAKSVLAADMDGDGDLDVLGAAHNADTIAWWENDGSGGGWTQHDASTSFDNARDVYAADMDGDGDTDILGAAETADDLTWWENTDGTGTAWTQHDVITDFDQPHSIRAADLDGDGDPDILGAAFYADDVTWWENETIHRSAYYPDAGKTTVAESFDGAISVYAADVDGDGDADLLGAAYYADDIAWWENTAGNGSAWTKYTVDGDFAKASSVYAADVDGDGDTDLLGGASDYPGTIAWWENTASDGSAWTEHTVAGQFQANIVYAADVDGDGDIDILGASDDDGAIAWWENTASDGSAWSKHTVVNYSFWGAESVYAADVDGDGDTDILGAADDDDEITWWENTAGDASAWTEYTVDGSFGGASSVHAADVDRDGDIDILGAASGADDIAWWENTAGDASAWTEHTVDGSFDGAVSVRASDLDGDGDTDILGGAAGAGDIAWWENTAGDASAWTKHTVDGSFGGARSAYAADVDGDGDPDILAAALAADDVAWWENRGGQFGLATVDTAPATVKGGDLEDLLAITLRHNGRAGEGPIEFATLELLFEESADDPLTSAEANALIETLYIYLDDGSGAFEAGSDTLVSATVETLALTAGVQTITFIDGGGNLRVDYGTPQTYFVVVEMTADAVMQTVAQLRVTHLTENGSTAEDRVHDLPLSLEYVANTSSSIITIKADTIYLAPDTPTCAGNSPCGFVAQFVLDRVDPAGNVIVLGNNTVAESLTGWDKNITVQSHNGGTLEWTGGANALFDLSGTSTITITGLSLACSSNCTGSTALNQSAGEAILYGNTATGFTTACNQSGGTLTAYDNTISNTGTAFQTTGTLEAYGNTLSGTGIAFQTAGDATLSGNSAAGFATAFDQTGGTLMAYANNITDFTTALDQTGGTHHLTHNWWGAAFLPSMPPGLDALSWMFRLGAPVESVASGEGSAALGDAELSGGTGTAVIVSHGRELANAPFGVGDTPAAETCSAYYDFFTIGGSGTWTVKVPVDADAACDATFDQSKLFWVPDITQCGAADDTDCYELVPNVSAETGPPRRLVADVSTTNLYGTPFTAGRQDGGDPTAVTLVAFQSRSPQLGIGSWLIPVLGLLGVVSCGGWRLWRLRPKKASR